MRLKAIGATIYAGEDVITPGEVFTIKDEKEALSLVSRGFAEIEPEQVQQRGRIERARNQAQPSLLPVQPPANPPADTKPTEAADAKPTD